MGLSGCTTASEGDTLFPQLSVTSVGPTPVLVGTRMHVSGAGFVPEDVASYEVHFISEAGEPAAAPAARLDPETLLVEIDAAAFAAIAGDRGGFTGELVVVRTIEGRQDRATLVTSMAFARAMRPSILPIDHPDAFLGERLTLRGERFLHPGEGTSLIRLDGAFVTRGVGARRDIEGLVVPARPPDPAGRDALDFVLTSDIFGVRPGHFEGTASIVNVLPAGELASDPVVVTALRLNAPVVHEVLPLRASRGQRITVTGRGLLPPDSLLEVATVFVLEGVLTPTEGLPIAYEGVDALVLYPDEHDRHTEATLVLHVSINDAGEPFGLGAIPGTFEGTLTPLIVGGQDAVEGAALPLRLVIENPEQVVWVRFLPDFSDALEDLGLLVESGAVAAKIIEIANRNYAPWNVRFVAAEPHEYAEYSIIDVQGADPNGRNYLGLDNTEGKDVGNLRFDDVIGGFNAETGAQNFAAYGGVFVAELMGKFSPTLNALDLPSEHFDVLFAPFAPALGGVPVTFAESSAEGGRGDAVREAVRALGTVVGEIVTHEVGHSLGLAVGGNAHNDGDNPGWIMDRGLYRPFEERAELLGHGPSIFGPDSAAYLDDILPRDL